MISIPRFKSHGNLLISLDTRWQIAPVKHYDPVAKAQIDCFKLTDRATGTKSLHRSVDAAKSKAIATIAGVK